MSSCLRIVSRALLLLFAISNTYLEAGWTPLPGITISATNSSEPQIGIDALGNATAIWVELNSDSTMTSIKFAILPKGSSTWSNPGTISSVAQFDLSAAPQISVNPSGYSIAIWEEFNGTNSTIKSATRAFFGDAWTSPLTVSLPNSSTPQVAIDPNGNAVAVWEEDQGPFRNIQSATLPFGAPAWTNLINLSDPTDNSINPQIGLDASGNGVAAWESGNSRGGGFINSRTYSGGVWLPTVNILSGANTLSLALSVGSSGVAVAAWSQLNVGFTTQAARFIGGVWSPASDLSTPVLSAQIEKDVAVDLNGNALVIWTTLDEGFNNDFIESSYLPISSNMWSAPILVSSPGVEALFPQAAFDANGNATAVWVAYNSFLTEGITQAAMLPFGTNSWINLTKLSKAGEITRFPQIAIDPSGYAVVDWQNETLTTVQAITFVPAPAITNINPNFGPPIGGNIITITGTNFINVSAVNFGLTSAVFIVNSPTSITVTVPPGSLGTVDVTVIASAGTSPLTVNDRYIYQNAAPSVINVNPNVGPQIGGNAVTITGTNFFNVSSVNFGGTAAFFIVNSPTSITAIAPPGTVGTVDITITTSAGTSLISASDQYTYQISAPVKPLPPLNFLGMIKTNKFLNKSECTLRATWNASPSPNIISYRIYKNNKVVATVLATSPLVYITCLPHCSSKGYEIASVNSNGLVSVHIPLLFLGE
ncbi:MAG: IPT/TIG domain-containing protein [Parachlamydiaceae bacterium]|nr:IPT/TIG domain-containing protein [Parachlamydiaceae bacterium]